MLQLTAKHYCHVLQLALWDISVLKITLFTILYVISSIFKLI